MRRRWNGVSERARVPLQRLQRLVHARHVCAQCPLRLLLRLGQVTRSDVCVGVPAAAAAAVPAATVKRRVPACAGRRIIQLRRHLLHSDVSVATVVRGSSGRLTATDGMVCRTRVRVMVEALRPLAVCKARGAFAATGVRCIGTNRAVAAVAVAVVAATVTGTVTVRVTLRVAVMGRTARA